MIQKLQNFFNTDKWWGTIVFLFLLNFLFLFISYLMFDFFSKINEILLRLSGGIFSLVYFIITIPLLSSIIVAKVKNRIQIYFNLLKVILINLLIIILLYLLLFLIIINSIQPNFF
jgi:hypothetical protein